MAKKKLKTEDLSTEERIKNAARKVFHKKGYAATRTRDIVEEAGINLALLNYYFRSKEKLFEIIMLETMGGFFQRIATIFNDESTSLEGKIELVATSYIDFLLVEPDIPIFILSELRGANPGRLIAKFNATEMLKNSVFARQYQQAIKEKRIVQRPIIHLVMNLIAFCVFPFIGSPLLKILGNLKDDQFKALIIERKTLIPIWIEATLKAR